MPPRNERIATMVRSELAKNPNVDNAALLAKARSIDPKVRRLSPRQFHATYRLPALRSVNARPANGKPAAPKASAPSPTSRAAAAPATPPATPTASAPAAPAASPAPASNAATAASAAPAAPAASSSKALARPHAAEREAVRSILQTVAREALGTEDRASFVRLLDSLDERAAVILSIFGRG
jgi:hypothetical protein